MTTSTDISQDNIGQTEVEHALDSAPSGSDRPSRGTIPQEPFTNPPSKFISKRTLILIMILAIAAISVGAITVSLFGTTQHDWDTGKQCLECHTDIGLEFTNMLGTPAIEPHEGMNCLDCHQNVSADFTVEHASTLPNCTSCHPTVATNMSYDTEAHKDLFTNAEGEGWGKGPNEACIVCHTGFDVSTSFERPDFYNFTIDVTYSITNVESSIATHTNTYTWTKAGNLHTYLTDTDMTCGDGVGG
ncbi:MAG: cytochrome c3 family protein, partial [Thermoplasmata archaeon]|nr:cytochrome c3 family protein [Thermoplasmata archaeon]